MCAVVSSDARLSDTAYVEEEPSQPPVETPLGHILHSMENFPMAQSLYNTLPWAFDH